MLLIAIKKKTTKLLANDSNRPNNKTPPKNRLSKNNILLNPPLVKPILLKTANSLFLNAILVDIVLKTEVTTIKELIHSNTSHQASFHLTI